MKHFSKIVGAWTQDHLLGRVVRNTSYLFSSSTASMGLTFLQGILAALLLGPENYGKLGIIVTFASTVNRLLSFRMGEVVVKYAGQYLALDRKEEAAGVVKAAGLAEAVTSVVAYLLLVLLAPLAARFIVKDPGTAPLIVIYGVALLASLIFETSTAALQLGNHYRTQAVINLAQSALTAGLILVAFIAHGSLTEVLGAYLFGKLLMGVATTLAAIYWMKPLLGEGWLRARLSVLPAKAEMAGFALSTNLSGTINMVFRDSELLWVGFFLGSVQAGYYKFALALMNVIALPITPFVSTTYPELARTIARREWASLRSLLRRTALIAAAWTLGCALVVLVLGQPVLHMLKNGEYLPAFPAILILLIGYGMANIFFWNRPLLLAMGDPNLPLLVNLLVGAIKTGLLFVVVRPFGYLAQAGLLSAYLALTVAIIVGAGLRRVFSAEKAALAGTPA